MPQNKSNYGHPMIASGVALTVALLKALDVTQNLPYEEFMLGDGRKFYYHPTSALTGDDVLVIEPTSGAGAYLLMPGAVTLKLPCTFATADAAVLLAIQAGTRLAIREFMWEVTTSFAGGASSAIGVSSNKAAPTSWVGKGDLLGGATGDVAATLVSTGVGNFVLGTIGTDFDTLAKKRGAIWTAADNILFDRITSVFTSGVGSVVVVGDLLANAGA